MIYRQVAIRPFRRKHELKLRLTCVRSRVDDSVPWGYGQLLEASVRSLCSSAGLHLEERADSMPKVPVGVVERQFRGRLLVRQTSATRRR